MRADIPPGAGSTQIDRLLWAVGVNTITQLARALGIPERTAGYWRKTGRVPAAQLARVAESHGVPLHWLMHGGESARAPKVTVGPAVSAPQSPLPDTAWPALIVKRAVTAVRDAEERAAVRLDADGLAEAVGIVIQMSPLSTVSPEMLADTVIGTFIKSGRAAAEQGKHKGRR